MPTIFSNEIRIKETVGFILLHAAAAAQKTPHRLARQEAMDWSNSQAWPSLSRRDRQFCSSSSLPVVEAIPPFDETHLRSSGGHCCRQTPAGGRARSPNP